VRCRAKSVGENLVPTPWAWSPFRDSAHTLSAGHLQMVSARSPSLTGSQWSPFSHFGDVRDRPHFFPSSTRQKYSDPKSCIQEAASEHWQIFLSTSHSRPLFDSQVSSPPQDCPYWTCFSAIAENNIRVSTKMRTYFRSILKE